MTNMHDARLMPEHAQVSTGIHDATANPGHDQCFDRAINGETFRDPAKIDNHSSAKKNPVVFAEKNVSPG